MKLENISTKEELLSFLSQTNLKVDDLIGAVNHSCADRNILLKVCNCFKQIFRFSPNKDDTVALATNIFNSFALTSDVIIEYLDSISYSTQYLEVIKMAASHPKSDYCVLTAIIQKINSSCYYIIDNILNNPNVNSRIICQIIDTIKTNADNKTIENILNHRLCDSTVLSKILSVFFQSSLNSYHQLSIDKNAVLLKILNHKNLNKDILQKILKLSNDIEITKKALENAYCDESILEDVVNKTNDEEVLLKAIKNPNITSNVLYFIVTKTSSENVAVAAVNSPQADITVLDKAFDFGKVPVYRAIASKSSASQILLYKIVDVSKDADTFISVINNHLVNEDILSSIFEKLGSISPADIERVITAIYAIKGIDFSKLKAINIPTSVKEQDNITQEPEIPTSNVEEEESTLDILRKNIEDGMSTMIWGASGVGKSARVKQIDPTYTKIVLKNDMLPEEVLGGIQPNGEPGEMYKPKWLTIIEEKCKLEHDRKHVLFIDEITNVKENVKNLVWDIIEDRTVNGIWTLPDQCVIVAAGNRPEESTSVRIDNQGRVLSTPLHDRFDFHLEIPFVMREWQEWALKFHEEPDGTKTLNIHPIVLSFCSSHPEVMFSELTEDITQPRLSPRRWEKVSKAIFAAEKRNGSKVSDARLSQCLGKSIGQAFISYYNKMPLDMSRVESGYYLPGDFPSIDDKLFALSSVLANYNGDIEALKDFIEYCLGDDFLALYEASVRQDELINLNGQKKAPL